MKPSLCASLAAAALGLAVLTAPRVAAADGDDTALTNLVALASQRLALAEPVAQWKWINKKPISDPPREAALLADVEKRATASGVDPAYARTFSTTRSPRASRCRTRSSRRGARRMAPKAPRPISRRARGRSSTG